MIQKHFEDIIRKKFGYDFSPTQQIAVEHFIRFFFAREEEGIFLLKGYAGTGKTSLVAAIVNALVSLEYKVVLLAPTGRRRFLPVMPDKRLLRSTKRFIVKSLRPMEKACLIWDLMPVLTPCFLSMRLR